LLHGPEIPDSLRHVRDWLYQLYGRSGMGMDGAAPLSHEELRAFCEFYDIRPTPDEVEALMMLDTVLRTASHEQAKKATPAQSNDANGSPMNRRGAR
jgi:hypothetical protein